jgi:hypothetical protein
MEESHGYKNQMNANGEYLNHTSNALQSDGSLRSICYEQIRQGCTDELFWRFGKGEAIPWAFDYGKKNNKYLVFAEDHYTEIMKHYAVFMKVVINSSSKTLLCSQEVHALVKKMFGGKHSLDAYFERNPDKFFSNSEEELEVACHPEYLNNRKFMQTYKVEYAEKSDRLFNKVRQYFNISSECTDGVDMVSLKKGTPAYELLLRKEKERAERQKEAYAKGEGNFQLAAKTKLRQLGIECDDATKAQSILEIVKCSKGEGNFQLMAKTELRQRGIECDDATKVQSILEIVKCSKGEGNFQLLAKTKLRQRGIECDDATKAQSILEATKCSMGEGNLQLAAQTELRQLGIECDDATKAQSILQSNKFANGEAPLQLTAKTELCQRGIECDDATKAQSILEATKCSMGEGNLQLAAMTELKN